MSWRTVALGSACDIIMGQAPAGETYNTEGVGLPLIAGAGDFGERSPEPSRFTTAAAKRSYVGDIVLCVRATIGDLNWSDKVYCLGRGVAGVRPKPGMADPRYIWWALDINRGELNSRGKGATFKQINRSDIDTLEIPLPPLDEQRRIAAIVDQADALRRKRREALARSENLVQATLAACCGDPASAIQRDPLMTLGDVTASVSDGPHVSPRYAEQGIPFLSTRNIRPGRIDWDDLKYISEEDARIQWKKVKPRRGDILYTKGGTTGIAKVVDFDMDFAVWVHVAILKLRSDLVDAAWLEAMLNSAHCYRQSQILTKGIANRDLGLRRMVNIEFPVPSLDVQHRFSENVKNISEACQSMRAHLAHLDTLFASLQHRAFCGEL